MHTMTHVEGDDEPLDLYVNEDYYTDVIYA